MTEMTVRYRTTPSDREAATETVALEYRIGAEYLLLLRHGGPAPADAEGNELTPYWAPLSPTNEQLFGGVSDAWFVWVSKELRRR